MADAHIPKLLQCHDKEYHEDEELERSHKDKVSYLGMGSIHRI